MEEMVPQGSHKSNFPCHVYEREFPSNNSQIYFLLVAILYQIISLK